MTRRVAIYGAGGFAREVAPLLNDADIVFVSDLCAEQGVVIQDRPVMSFEQLCLPEHHDREVVLAIGHSAARRQLAHKCVAAGLRFGSVMAPTARILRDTILGEGSVICDFCVLTADIRVGVHFEMNLHSYIGHDCIIGDYVTFAPNVACNGHVTIEAGAYIGTGACLRQGSAARPLRIGADSIIGMGAVVTSDVPAGETWVGVPARRLH